MDTLRSAQKAALTVELLSGQADGLITAWERTIETERPKPTGAPGGEMALAELASELVNLEREESSIRSLVNAEGHLATEWEARASLAASEGRRTLAAQATGRAQEHREAMEALGIEADAMAQVADQYRGAIASKRDRTGPTGR